MRSNHSKSSQTAASTNVQTPDGSRVVWGFMFENTLFTEFERRNHPIIEAAYRQRKKKHTSHYITITDSNLPKPGKAKVYFGVAQNHLRMPGTRYYVNRQVIRPATSESIPRSSNPVVTPPMPPVSSPYPLPVQIPSPTSTFSSSSFSSMDTSFSYPNAHNNSLQYPQPQTNNNALAAVFADDLPLFDLGNYPLNFNVNAASYINPQFNYYNVDDFLDMNLNFNTSYSTAKECNYSNNAIALASNNPCNCNCYIPDFNNMIQNQNWVNELISLGLFP